MGFRRRTRRRAVVAGAAIAHHENNQQQEQSYAPAPAEAYPSEAQPVPPQVDPADEIEHLAELHASGVLTDEEFAAAKAKALGS